MAASSIEISPEEVSTTRGVDGVKRGSPERGSLIGSFVYQAGTGVSLAYVGGLIYAARGLRLPSMAPVSAGTLTPVSPGEARPACSSRRKALRFTGLTPTSWRLRWTWDPRACRTSTWWD